MLLWSKGLPHTYVGLFLDIAHRFTETGIYSWPLVWVSYFRFFKKQTNCFCFFVLVFCLFFGLFLCCKYSKNWFCVLVTVGRGTTTLCCFVLHHHFAHLCCRVWVKCRVYNDVLLGSTLFFWGCSLGGFYLPCIYLCANNSCHRWFRSLLLCPLLNVQCHLNAFYITSIAGWLVCLWFFCI